MCDTAHAKMVGMRPHNRRVIIHGSKVLQSRMLYCIVCQSSADAWSDVRCQLCGSGEKYIRYGHINVFDLMQHRYRLTVAIAREQEV